MFRLKEQHPAMIALEKLYNAAYELGITIEFMGPRTLVTFNGEVYDLHDIDQPSYPMNSFPPACEYKLIYDTERETE